jgi:hypothetical protein
MKIEYFLTLITIIVGFLVEFIAYRQFILAKDRFKLDLFEKRFAIYKGVQSLLSYILEKGNVTLDKIFQFRAETQDAPFLFNDDIPLYLKEIDKNALHLWSTTEQRKAKPQGNERSILAEKETELVKSLIGKLPELQNIFSPYLKFKTWK